MIYEIVVTTVDRQDNVHVAPMAIRFEDGFTVIAPSKPSQTLANIEATGVAVANTTDDVRVFAGCVTGRTEWPVFPASMVKGYALDAAVSHSELKVVKQADDALRPRIYMIEVSNSVSRPFRGFNRAQAAVIEGAILVGQLHVLPAEKIDSEMAYLSIALEKTAGSKEREAWQWLLDEIEDYRNKPVEGTC